MPLNSGHTYLERLGPECEGLALLDYLAVRYRHTPPETWRERIDAGLVRLDGAAVAPSSVLRAGQALAWHRPAWEEPDAPLAFEIVYEDDDLLAVHKPAGLPTLPGASFLEHTLWHQVRRSAPEAAPLHRLGRFTSGIVLFARTRASRAALTRQWIEREVEKDYLAVATGSPTWETLAIDVPIGPVPHATLGTVHAASASGKPALSRVTVVERRRETFLCEVSITTGRPHQVRIHLAAAGHPLAGDPLYAAGGVPASGSHALPGDPGYHLHAARLRFRHPRDGREVSLSCEPTSPPSPEPWPWPAPRR